MKTLVLTRKEGEVIKIGEDITIILNKARSGQARIAIEAPRNVTIYREEIYYRIKEEEFEL